jgi:hypothetical protein
VSTLHRIAYRGWPNVLRLSGRRVELLVTADVGPRILRFGFRGGRNVFHEVPQHRGLTGGAGWRMVGGHRLWSAPETPQTYAPDNEPVRWSWRSGVLALTGPTDRSGLQKKLLIGVDRRDRVHVKHVLFNRNRSAISMAPWAITVMAAGGRAIVPQEKFRLSADFKLPARSLVLWHYTDMTDRRWTWGSKFIQLRYDRRAKTVQKLGIWNRKGWAAYALRDHVFIKRFPALEGATYPDFGSNNEIFAHWDFIEIESLGPLVKLRPGQSTTHTEVWSLHRKKLPREDAAMDRAFRGLRFR